MNLNYVIIRFIIYPVKQHIQLINLLKLVVEYDDVWM